MLRLAACRVDVGSEQEYSKLTFGQNRGGAHNGVAGQRAQRDRLKEGELDEDRAGAEHGALDHTQLHHCQQDTAGGGQNVGTTERECRATV